jgi:hypothetical protein
MRWNIHPSAGQEGLKYIAFLSQNNTNRVYLINAKEVKKMLIQYITILQ